MQLESIDDDHRTVNYEEMLYESPALSRRAPDWMLQARLRDFESIYSKLHC